MYPERQNLVYRLFPGNQADMNQIVSGLFQRHEIHGKPAHDRIVSIIAQAAGVTDRHQKQVQGRRYMAASLDMTLMHQAVIQPTEVSGYLSDPLRKDGGFWNQDVLLCCLMGD